MDPFRRLIDIVEGKSSKEEELQSVIDNAINNGVVLDAQLFNDNTIGLVDIERTAGSKGSGKQVLSDLCNFADKHDLEIILHVAGGMYKLIDLYRSFGFEFDETDNEDHPVGDEHSIGYEVEMYRIPR